MGLGQVISLDGGGIRGIMSATVVQRFEEVKDGRASDYFDEWVGTSIGSLIAAANTSPSIDSAKKVVELFCEQAPTIFHRSFYQEAVSLNGIRSSKYTDTGLVEALKAFGGDHKFVELKRNVRFPAVDLTTRQLFWFSRDDARARGWHDLSLTDVLRATTAAPTYFPGKTINLDGLDHEFLDGGITCNNPVGDAVIQAFDGHRSRPRIMVLSIGTGRVKEDVPKPVFEHGGEIEWISPLLDTISEFQEHSSTIQARRLLANPQNLMRIEPVLKQAILLDDASKLGELHKVAVDWLHDHDDQFREFCAKIKKITNE